MTAARRLAAILAADVGVREHRDGTSDNRANSSFPQSSHRNHAGACKTPQGLRGQGGLLKAASEPHSARRPA